MRARFTIRARVTLWYTLLTALIMLAALWATVWGARRAADYYLENMLIEAVSAAADAVRWQGAAPRLNMEDAPDFGDKVSFALLDGDGSLWQGHWPPFGAELSDGEVRRARDAGGREYLVQDLLVVSGEGSAWLRGYLRADALQFVQAEALLIARYALPGLLLLAAAGGYLLTRRAFRPVGRMARAAEGIAEGGDLRRRFEAGGRDEIAALAGAFNAMFTRLQGAFEREKRFTDDAAHELRTPVAVIRAACEQALASGDPADMREGLLAIRDKSAHMGDMLSQLLALARVEAGRAPFVAETVDLNEICLCAAQEAADAARDKGIALVTRPGDAPYVGDELLLTRLVILLLDNALKFTGAGGTITLFASAAADGALLTVADTGVGMDAQTAAHIFERFYQADAARTSGGGAGLGLALALSIARLHGGDISLRSAPGEGATFTVALPRAKEAKNAKKDL